MTVSAGNLDSLLNKSFPSANFTSVSVQSVNGVSVTSPGNASYSGVTLNTTGVPAPGTVSGETINVVGVNDAYNTVTLSLMLGGQSIGQVTDYVNGYNADGLLLSGLNTASFAETSPSLLNDVAGVLSSAPIPAQTPLTFSLSGSSSITPPSSPKPPWLQTLGPPNNFSVSDQSGAYAGGSWQAQGSAYTGPVTGLTSEFIAATSDNINVTAAIPNVFISTGGSGEDAISVAGVNGNNVLNGSTGSSFLYGVVGNDTFFVDNRNPPSGSSIWSTVVGFHAGDDATVWGVTPNDFSLSWIDGQGATGYSGLTLHATATSKPTASLTLTGLTSADLSNGSLSVSYGRTQDLPNLPGSDYMLIHHN